MALRYRNSINLGGGFRVNISKSGVGYSWGFKGYRVTHKAGGGKRTTYSLPGTGLSWDSIVLLLSILRVLHKHILLLC